MGEVNMLPQGSILTIETEEEYIEATKTYKIDFEKGRIVGLCDDVEALKQAIYLILSTERYEYLIYSDDYGIESKGVVGKESGIAESESKRVITEALLQDDRINRLDNFIFIKEKDGLSVRFTVFSVYGEFEVDKGVI